MQLKARGMKEHSLASNLSGAQYYSARNIKSKLHKGVSQTANAAQMTQDITTHTPVSISILHPNSKRENGAGYLKSQGQLIFGRVFTLESLFSPEFVSHVVHTELPSQTRFFLLLSQSFLMFQKTVMRDTESIVSLLELVILIDHRLQLLLQTLKTFFLPSPKSALRLSILF